MDFARSVAHLSILNPGAPTGCTGNTLGGSDVVSPYYRFYISNLGKKCPLCAFNATGGQITVKSIQGLSGEKLQMSVEVQNNFAYSALSLSITIHYI